MRALCLLVLAASISASAQTPDELLRLAQDAFTNPNGYEFDGSGLLQPEGSSWQVKFSVVFAAAPASPATPQAPVHPVGRVGGPFQFVKTGAGSDEKPRWSVPFVVAGRWNTMATNVTSAEEVGTEQLPLNGEITDCRVIEVHYRPLAGGTVLPPVRYSICSEKHLALKKTMTYAMATGGVGLYTITFDTAKLGAVARVLPRDGSKPEAANGGCIDQ